MDKDFKKYFFDDIGDIITGKTPPTKNLANYGDEYMFLGPTDLHKHFLITKSEKMVSTQGLESVKGSVLNGVSILVGCIGWDMGNVGIVNTKCVTNQQINSITNIKDSFNPYYIYYWLKGKKDFLFSQASVTRTPILKKSDFAKLPIYIPNKNIQDKIASVLSSLDKKIELNNKINQQLEDMAKTLYDYWFVQFDFPDANGKPYKSSGGKMVYSEELKREIPEGWKVKELKDIVDVSNESLNPMIEPDTNYKHYSIPTFDKMKTYAIEKGRTIKSNKYIVKENDILVSKLNPKFNRVIYPINEDNLICSTEFVVWRAKNNFLKNYLFIVAKQKHFIEYCIQSSSGTSNSHKRVNPTVMMEYKFAYNEKIINLYGDKMASMLHMIIKNQFQNQKLIELRDWLLPMLMNGQVKVNS